MSFPKMLLCLIGIHLPIRRKNPPYTMHRAECACGEKHWRWFER